MQALPRGGLRGNFDVPLGTSDWAQPRAIERMVYSGGSALFLGAIPYEDGREKLDAFRVKASQAAEHIEAAAIPPFKRAGLLKELDRLWLQAQLSDCVPIGIDDDRHMVTVAGARSGKGRSSIIPNLCLYPGSAVVLDPKGENASLTAARRGPGDEWTQGLGQAVYVLDPFGVADVPQEVKAGLNPLESLDPSSQLIVDDASLLAEGLVVSNTEHESHWDETARNFVKGLILHLVTTREEGKPCPTLFDLRVALTTGDEAGWNQACADDPDYKAKCPNAFWHLLDQMRANDALKGAVAGAGASLADTGENERGSILSTARRNTAFLDTLGPFFRATLSGKGRTLSPDELKDRKEGTTVYLCLPAERMNTHGRWLRLMIGLFLERMQRNLNPPASGAPVLFLLEEFFTLGAMPAVEKAAGYAAGFGVKLWPILQDLNQLKSLYPQSWLTFLANAGAVHIFGASDTETLEYVSKALGTIEVTKVSRTLNEGSGENFSQSAPADVVSSTVGGLLGPQSKIAAAQLAVRGLLDSKSRSGGWNKALSTSEQVQNTPLLNPDEVARAFSRESGAGLLLVKGRRPVACLRVNYDESPWFRGFYTPLAAHRAGLTSQKGQARSLDARPDEPLAASAAAYNAVIRKAGLA